MIVDFIKTFAQVNKGDVSGTVWSTKNIDPDFNPGKVNISKYFGYSTNTDDQANLELPAAGFAFTAAFATDRYFAVADDRVWESASTNPDSSWSEVSGTPTDCDLNSDIIAFNAKIYVATQNNLKSYDGSSFANITGGIDATAHSMCIYKNRLYVSSNSEKVYSMDTAETLSKTSSNTIDLNDTTGENQLITKIASVSNGIWIATVYTDKAGGEVIFWDGVTANVADKRFQMPRGILSLVIKNDRPYVIDSLGRLQVFDGTTFVEIARLPIKTESLNNFNENDNNRFIHPNGMILVNDEIYVLVSNKINDTTQDPIEQMGSGVWAYNENYGFYLKYTFGNVDILTATPTVTDFGTTELSQVGALFASDATGGTTVDVNHQSEILAGVKYYSDATTEKTAFGITNVANDVKKGGYLITAQLRAEQFDEIWQEIVAAYDKFKNSTDRIIVKYRTSEDTPLYATGKWSSDTLLRSTDDLSTVENDDEVEILRGTGSGVCAHITSITGTYRLQLDYNPLSGMTGTCRFRVQKWQKIGTADTTDDYMLRKTLDAKPGAWVQFKVFMVGTGKSPQLHKLLSVSESHSNTK